MGIVEFLRQIPDIHFTENENMAERTSLKVGGAARYFVCPDSVYALCRGMFMVNGILGGKVLRGGSASKPRHDHYVTFQDGSQALVNTYHNSAVPESLLAPELEALAWETGTPNVEAYRSVEKRILGLQWHPERPLPSEESITATERLFDWLLNGTPLPEHILEQ